MIEKETGTLVQEMTIKLNTGESAHLSINFSTKFKLDMYSEVVRSQLVIAYAEHQENVIYLNFFISNLFILPYFHNLTDLI